MTENEPMLRTFVVTGTDSPGRMDGTEVCLGLGRVDGDTGALILHGESTQDRSVISYHDVWLENVTVNEWSRVPDELPDQVADPYWAARGLRQALMALVLNEEVRPLLLEKAPAMLAGLDDILCMTAEIAHFDPPTIEETA